MTEARLDQFRILLQDHPAPWRVAEGSRSQLGPAYWRNLRIEDGNARVIASLSGPDPAGVASRTARNLCDLINELTVSLNNQQDPVSSRR